MIGSLIAALIGNYMTTCFAIGLIVGLVAVARHRGPRTPESSSGLLLNAYVLWAIGVAQAINFVMHSVFGDFAAASIGWAQSPFQLELAFSSLGVAVMAFILHGRHAPFRGKVAVVIATSPLWLAALILFFPIRALVRRRRAKAARPVAPAVPPVSPQAPPPADEPQSDG